MTVDKPGTRAETLVASIEAQIEQQQLSPGAWLGTKEDLRTRSGFARATVNEAVRLLESRGRVVIKPGRGGGLYVAAASPIVRLRHTLLTVDDASSVADAIAMRDALELLVATDATRHCTRQDVADLRKQLTVMRRATDSTDAFMRANWALHERIARVSPNQMLQGVYLGLTQCIAEHAITAESDDPGHRTEHMANRLDVHIALVDAIASGDLARTRVAVERHAGGTAEAGSLG
ncbi:MULTISPECIES: FCD domain-containing protein [unclassified Streptomyces]|uniref:FadR/GntR family transcriptional regulator n=1 Tax=unclassified Streptomyces TaxID=2593676 RepID=UPI003441A5D9